MNEIRNLTEEQRRKINQFIAEKCGITMSMVARLPDYTRSLNACHDGEKALTADQCEAYLDNLCGVLPHDWTAPGWVFHATAEQRALALFTTLGGVL